MRASFVFLRWKIVKPVCLLMAVIGRGGNEDREKTTAGTKS